MKHFLFFILLMILAISCHVDRTAVDKNNSGGIVFTFDDQYIDGWYNFRDKFNEYNIKATFFINRPQNLTEIQVKKLKQLVSEGHEIGCHGFNHRNALDFKDSVNRYYVVDVKPAIEKLESLGFDIKSFAYPFGNSTEQIDSFLSTHLTYLRKATWNMKDTTIDFYDDVFATSDSYRITNSMGIDNNYRITLENLEKGMQRAKRNNEVLVLHDHNIDTSKNNYIVNPDYLESVFKLSNKYGLKSMRLCDLKSYFGGH